MKSVVKKLDPALNGRCYVARGGYLGDDDLVTGSGDIWVFDSAMLAGEFVDGISKHYPGSRWAIERA